MLGSLLDSLVPATVLFDSGASHSFIAPSYLIIFVSIFASNQSHSFISRYFISQSDLLPSSLASYLLVLLIHVGHSQCTYMNSQSWRLVSQTLLQLSWDPWIIFPRMAWPLRHPLPWPSSFGHLLQKLSSKFLQHVFLWCTLINILPCFSIHGRMLFP